PINQLAGPQQSVAEILEQAPHASAKDYEDMLARLNAVPELLTQTMILLQKGIDAGITPPRVTLRDVPQQIKSQMIEDPAKNAMPNPSTKFPAGIPEPDRQRLRQEAARALKEKIIPAFNKLNDFFVKTYLPHTRESIALSDLPDGKAWYAFNVRVQTTTS